MNRAGGRRDETTSTPFPRVLGRYHLLEELSENSVGVLHLARLEGPKGFQRWSAVRRVHPHLAADAVFIQDFYDAAKAAASIRHPNVEATLDVGETDGTHWMALEYLHGERVAHLVSRAEIAETGVAWDVACRIIAQTALGLEAVHASQDSRGPPFALNHARLTPRQIFVSYEGETKILEAVVPRRASSALSSDVLPYMSPEQVWGEPSDRRADIFSLGVVLWEMCAGRRLFLGDDDDGTREMLEKHVVPRLETKVRGLPRRVDEIIALALAVEPRHRFSTAQDLARAIDEALVAESLVVTDYDAGRYMKALFADRFAAREERLRRAADATEIFNRASLPPSVRSPRASIPPPSLPPERLRRARRSLPIPEPAPTTRDVHEMPTVEGIAADPYRLDDSNEVHTSVMGEAERAMLIAEANPLHAKTDESEAATAPLISGLDYDETGEDDRTVADDPIPEPDLVSGPISEPEPEPRTRPQVEMYGPVSTAVGPPPEPARHAAPAYVREVERTNERPTFVRQVAERAASEHPGFEQPRGNPAQYPSDRPPTVEINATPPPMSAVEAAQVASDGYLRLPPPNYPSSFPPGPLPPTAQTYMISPKAPHELSMVAWLFALAVAVAGIALIYASWSRSQTASTQNTDTVTPATATIPTATGTATPTSTSTSTSIRAQDLPQSATGVVSPFPTHPPKGTRSQSHPITHKPFSPPPPVTRDDPVTPPPAPVAGGSGFLTVICTPACDDVLDGNASLGPSPVFKAQVRSGPHRITMKTIDPPSTKSVTVTVPTDDTFVVKQSMGD
ncbi:MAG: protein kinase [Polyangiaceae bacterium]